MELRTIYRIEDGILAGTEIEPVLGLVCVKYPHRKTPDLYVPPMKAGDKETKTWHCCQDCAQPDFEGGIEALVDHLMLHKGRLVKPWSKKAQLKAPMPAVRLPPNPWDDKPSQGVNEDRRFCIELYMGNVKSLLRKQGLEIIESDGGAKCQ